MPFKDVFRADPEVAGDNGEPEALLSALSTGPVGLGDRVGRFDPTLALRTCRADGLLVKPDVPIAATGRVDVRAVRRSAASCSSPSAGPTTRPAAGPTCSASTPTRPTTRSRADHRSPGSATPRPAGDVVAWDWRARTAHPAGRRRRLAGLAGPQEGWTYLVLAPVLASGLAVIGDVDLFVTAGDARIEVSELPDGARVVVKGAGEVVTVTGWAPSAPAVDGHEVAHDAESGVWQVRVEVPSRGWATVDITL